MNSFAQILASIGLHLGQTTVVSRGIPNLRYRYNPAGGGYEASLSLDHGVGHLIASWSSPWLAAVD